MCMNSIYNSFVLFTRVACLIGIVMMVVRNNSMQEYG